MITCNHKLVSDFEENKKKKTVHFSDENKFLISQIKQLYKSENKILSSPNNTYISDAKNNFPTKENNSFLSDLLKGKISINPKNEK